MKFIAQGDGDEEDSDSKEEDPGYHYHDKVLRSIFFPFASREEELFWLLVLKLKISTEKTDAILLLLRDGRLSQEKFGAIKSTTALLARVQSSYSQIDQEVRERGLSDRQEKLIMRHYGITTAPGPWDGIRVDPHKQSFWGPSHLLRCGIMKYVLVNCFENLPKHAQLEYLVRLADFPLPKGSPRLRIEIFFGPHFSMTAWQMLGVVSQYAMRFLAEVDDMKLIIKIVRFEAQLSMPLKKDDLPGLEAAARSILRVGADKLPGPNAHGSSTIVVVLIVPVIEVPRQ